MHDPMPAKLDLTVYLDFICPWCLIGKRHLKLALDQFGTAHPDVAIAVDWRSHPLLPDTPAAGIPYQAFYEKRLGGKAAVAARREQVRQAARAAGLELAFEHIELLPNTLAAHRLIACATRLGNPQQLDTLIDRIFTAYFQAGRDIGDIAVLLDIAAAAGYAADDIRRGLAAAERYRPESRTADRGHEVSGVPFFVFNDRLAISGAHPPASLLAAMAQALQPASAST